MKTHKNLRGDPFSIIIIIASVLLISVIYMFVSGFATSLYTDMFNEANATGSGYSNASIETLEKAKTDTVPIADNIVFWFFVAATIGFWLSSAYLSFHPGTIALYVIVILMGVYLGTIGADIRDDFRIDLTDMYSNSHILSNAIFGRYYPAIIAFIGIIGLVIMFAKKGGGNPGQ